MLVFSEKNRSRAAVAVLFCAFPVLWIGGPLAAVWPSITALALILLLRQVLPGLLGGALAGALILQSGNPLAAFISLFEDHLLPAFGSNWKVGAILFTFMLGGFAALLEAGGGFRRLFLKVASGGDRRRLLGSAGAFGLVCFFDGLANSMMIGRIFRSWADRLGIARVKLAYLADTTSSAVACLAFVSTWIAYQLAMIQEGFALSGRSAEAQPYQLFFQSIPYNYYSWISLILLAVVIWRDWNIGPMKSFEERARKGFPTVKGGSWNDSPPQGSADQALWRAALPLIFLVFSIFAGLYFSGIAENAVFPITLTKVAEAFGRADAALVLVVSSAAASLLAFVLYPRERNNQLSEPAPDEVAKPSTVYMEGVQSLFGAVLVLLAAWMLSSTLGALGAGKALSLLLAGNLPVAFLPAAIFLLGALISFTTGTSWGTMGILMPLAIPIAFSLGADALLDEDSLQSLMAAIVGAVFSGAVFGDHCSPLSDTTLVSSIACGIEPHDHVRTQLPYAAIAAGGALVVGFIPVGFGLSPWIALLLATALTVSLPFLFGPRNPS
jgi:tetracycline resistance efflux pump